METICVFVKNEGARGVKITTDPVDGRPDGCPGLGGWKPNTDGGGFSTVIKWPHAKQVLDAMNLNPSASICMLSLNGDKMTSVEAI